MHSDSDLSKVQRRAVAALVVQFVLLGATILAARSGAGGRMGTAAVMLLAGANAVVVAVTLMGVRRDGRWPSMLALLTLVLLAGLLVWPAWDISQRARWF